MHVDDFGRDVLVSKWHLSLILQHSHSWQLHIVAPVRWNKGIPYQCEKKTSGGKLATTEKACCMCSIADCLILLSELTEFLSLLLSAA